MSLEYSTEGRASARSAYRPEIDGLRALAVLAVIVQHFDRRLLPSGYLGVDIFFVISGFVITSSLADRPAKNLRDLLLGFYSRRVRRIVPALVLCVVVTSALAVLAVPGGGARLSTGIASLVGVSNFHLLREAMDYFGTSAELDFFTQTWSLGVEEQFYAVFPLLVWFSGFGRKGSAGSRTLVGLMAAIGAASLIGFVHLSGTNQAAAYYLMPTRLWELGAGCLLAVGPGGSRRSPIGGLRRVPPLVVFAGVVAVLFAPVESSVAATIAVVALTALLIASLRPGTAGQAMLSLPAAVYVGRISYSLYLWHWSVLALSRWTVGIHWWSVPVQLAAMGLLAASSTRFLEEPLRRAEWSPRRVKTIAFGIVASVGSAALVLGLESAAVAPSADAPGAAGEKWLGNGTTLTQENCHARGNPFSRGYRSNCFLPSETGQNLLALGDSQTAHLIPLLSKLHLDDGLGIRFHSSSGHPFPAVPESRSDGESLRDWGRLEAKMERFFDRHLARLRAGDLVVLSSRDELRWSPYPLNTSLRGTLKFSFYDDDGRSLSKREAYTLWKRKLSGVATAAGARGVSVVALTPIPVFEEVLAPSVTHPSWLNRLARPQGVEREFVVRHFSAVTAALREIERAHENFHVFDAFESVCPRYLPWCLPRVNGTLLYKDQWHLSNDGSNALYEPFRTFLRDQGLLRPRRPTT